MAGRFVDEQNGELSLPERLRCRIRFFTDGVILGSQSLPASRLEGLHPRCPSQPRFPVLSPLIRPVPLFPLPALRNSRAGRLIDSEIRNLARAEIFRGRWTDKIHEEWMRNLAQDKPDIMAEGCLKSPNVYNKKAKGKSWIHGREKPSSIRQADRYDRKAEPQEITSY